MKSYRQKWSDKKTIPCLLNNITIFISTIKTVLLKKIPYIYKAIKKSESEVVRVLIYEIDQLKLRTRILTRDLTKSHRPFINTFVVTDTLLLLKSLLSIKGTGQSELLAKRVEKLAIDVSINTVLPLYG